MSSLTGVTELPDIFFFIKLSYQHYGLSVLSLINHAIGFYPTYFPHSTVGYPGRSLNDARLQDNFLFYSNKLKSSPNGDYIDTIHE